MPSACQPSKKSAAMSTERRYFATALSRSPMAMSPLASSKISSGVCILSVSGADQGAPSASWRARFLADLAFSRFKASRLLPVVQPFVENDALLVMEKPFLKRCLLLASITIREWLSLLQNSDKSIITRRRKIADLAGTQECHSFFDRGKIRRFVLRFLALGGRLILWFL